MKTRYGIVYLGSKEKILHLLQHVFEREYKKKFMIDLFTGGFSVSGYALKHTSFNVIANDINPYVIALYRAIFDENEELEEKKYDWISREHFENVQNNPDKYPKWYVGYVLNVWSFGCNQKDYLYGKDIEEKKRVLHEAIVNNKTEIMQKDFFNDFKIPDKVRNVDYRKFPQKRLSFMRYFKQYAKISGNEELLRLIQLEHLQQMEHLSAIYRAKKNKERVSLLDLDWLELYEEIPENILKESFIYCDPPYENKKEYMFGNDMNYEKFWNWFRTCPYSVYVSSYTAPSDIKKLTFAKKAQLLDNGAKRNNRKRKRKYVEENIYWNEKGDAVPTFGDLLFIDE